MEFPNEGWERLCPSVPPDPFKESYTTSFDPYIAQQHRSGYTQRADETTKTERVKGPKESYTVAGIAEQ